MLQETYHTRHEFSSSIEDPQDTGDVDWSTATPRRFLCDLGVFFFLRTMYVSYYVPVLCALICKREDDAAKTTDLLT